MAPYGANIFGLSDPDIDALLDEGLTETDPEKRLAIFQDLQEKIVEKTPCIFLYIPSTFDCVRFNVMNSVHSPNELTEFYELYKQ